MRKLSRWNPGSVWLALALALAGCDDDDGPSPDGGSLDGGSLDGGATSELTRALIADLEREGFEVGRGRPILYQADDCERFTYPVTTNCWANNPAAPYVAVTVEPWPNEYVDPIVAEVMGGVVPGLTGVYRLDPREAILVYGRLPPSGKYFGIQTWVFSQEGRWSDAAYERWAATPDLAIPLQYLFDTIPADDPTSSRVQSLSAISNIINNVVVERQSGSAFGEVRYFMVTPDRTMDEALRAALARVGVPDRHIFTEPIPQRDELGSIGPIGLEREANDFMTFIRYALPDDPAAGEAWRSELPLTVLRVRATEGTPAPYPLFTFEPRTAVDEVGDAELTSDFASLNRSVCERARSALWNLEGADCDEPPSPSSVMADLVADYGWTGPYCRSVGMDCLGDQQDAAYFFAPPLPLDDGQAYAVVGTLGTRTGNATYSALSVNDPSLFKGAVNVLDTSLEGSANAYAATLDDPARLFVWFFARDCEAISDLTDGHCTSITPAMVPLRGDSSALGDPSLHGTFQIGIRHYIRPGTARGPDSSRLIRPRVLSFTRTGAGPR